MRRITMISIAIGGKHQLALPINVLITGICIEREEVSYFGKYVSYRIMV